MPQMNKATHNIQSQGWNPVTALSNKLGSAASSANSKAGGFMHMAVSQKMQGAQHEHEKIMQGAQHEHEKKVILTQGGVDMEKDALNNRHERRMAVLNHNKTMEKIATEHNNAIHSDAAATANRMKESAQNQSHEIAVKTLADTHASNASTRAASFLDALHKHAEGGTEASVNHEGLQASFTFAKPTVPAQEAPAQEAPAAESKPAGPVSVGMPSMPPIKAAPTANKSVVGRDAKGRATSLKKTSPAPTKKSTPATKGASVKRDPKTGRAISMKKK
jgi:hypothetical protein